MATLLGLMLLVIVLLLTAQKVTVEATLKAYALSICYSSSFGIVILATIGLLLINFLTCIIYPVLRRKKTLMGELLFALSVVVGFAAVVFVFLGLVFLSREKELGHIVETLMSFSSSKSGPTQLSYMDIRKAIGLLGISLPLLSLA